MRLLQFQILLYLKSSSICSLLRENKFFPQNSLFAVEVHSYSHISLKTKLFSYKQYLKGKKNGYI